MSSFNDLSFHAFDPERDVAIRERKLPHWFQPNTAVFITFRTLDSLPCEVVQRMTRELEEWLAERNLPIELGGSSFKSKLPTYWKLLQALSPVEYREFHRLKERLIHRELDSCHGACLLRRPELSGIVANAIRYGDGERFDLDCFVIMPNHVHAIVQFRDGFDFTVVGQSWMRYSARLIHEAIKVKGSFWQDEPFDHLVRSSEQFIYLRKYIADNPIKAKLRRGEYVLWTKP
ncbi:MAG: transposase [Pirellulales bacterium]